MNKRLYTYNYRNEYDPAMPVMEVGISLPKRDRPEITVSALLDSGSDGTLLPIDINVLNHLVITLNGHASVVEMTE